MNRLRARYAGDTPGADYPDEDVRKVFVDSHFYSFAFEAAF